MIKLHTPFFVLHAFWIFSIIVFSARSSAATSGSRDLNNGFQQQKSSGIVLDESGNPLAGATIMEKGLNKGATTDLEGKFSLELSKQGAILKISYIGFKTLELEASVGMIIQMTTDVEALEDVVLVGYGSTRKKDATGSVSIINSSKFNQGVMVSPEQTLIGKLSGVQITPSSGAPGSASTIRIRGGSSLSASNDPLFVVDGLPLDNGVTVAASANPLNFINPNDIESITVLKDASATAIYGARASNGVVLITTKTGGKEKNKWSFNMDSKTALASRMKGVDVLSGDQFRGVVNTNGTQQAKDLLGTSNTDWQSAIFRSALTYDNNLSATGRVLGTSMRVSLGYLYNDGILLTDNLQKLTGSVKASRSFLDDHMDVTLNILGSKQNSIFADGGAIGSAVSMDPTKPIYSGSPDYGGFYEWTDANGLSPRATRNPVALLKLINNQGVNYRSVGNAKLDYKLHMFPDIKLSANIGYDYSDSGGSNTTPPFAAVAFYRGGANSIYSQTRFNNLVDFYANYIKNFESFISRIDITGGYSYQKFRYSNHSKDQPYDRQSTITDLTDSDERVIIGFFGRANVNLFKDKYLLTTTLRYDGSSRFGSDHRWGLFPSLALAWKIKEEDFLKPIGFISNLKLRTGYGVTGQENIGSSYPYLPTFTQSNIYAQYPIGLGEFIRVVRPNAYDANITWEEQTTYNAGIDYGFFNDRLSGTVDVYLKTTDRLLVKNAPIPLGANLNNQITTNVGGLENYGTEASINGKLVDTKDITIDAGYNITFNQNRITKLSLIDDPNFLGIQTGSITGGKGNTVAIHKVGYPAGTFYLYQQIYDTNGKPIEGLFADLNNDGVINEEDRRPYRPSQANLYMGFNLSFKYKNWKMGFSTRASFNNFVYNNIRSGLGNFSAVSGSVTNGYLINLSADYLKYGFTSQDSKRYFSDYYLENGAFLKMDYAYFGYSFPKPFKGAGPLYLGITVQNAFFLTQYTGIDPEVDEGIDNNFYPRPRIFLININYNF